MHCAHLSKKRLNSSNRVCISWSLTYFHPANATRKESTGRSGRKFTDHSSCRRDKPLTLAAYSAGPVKAYVEPVAVGDVMPDMPLFLDPDRHVPAPLEATYQATLGRVSRRR